MPQYVVDAYSVHLHSWEIWVPSRTIRNLSITKAGNIGLPKHFVTKHGITRGMRAHLYWDEDHGTVAIYFEVTENQATYSVHFTDKSGAFIQSSKFFSTIRLKPEHYQGRYDYKRMRTDQAGITDVRGEVFVFGLVKSTADYALGPHA